MIRRGIARVTGFIAAALAIVMLVVFGVAADVTYIPQFVNPTFVGTILVGGTSTSSSVLLLPDGSVNNPSLGWIGDNDGTGTGWYRSAANVISYTANGGERIRLHDASGFSYFASGVASTIGFGLTTALGGAPDVRLVRAGAASLQQGVDVNGAPVDQTFKAHNGITGTDVKGASLTVAGGLGTGAAVSNPFIVNGVVTKATGTTAQTYTPRIVVCPSKILSNTSATTTTIATITTTTTTGGNITMDYGTLACSGSTCDADGGVVKVAWNNNAGTVAAAMTAVVLQADSDATGNITTGPTATVATNVVSVKVTPVFTTIVPTSVNFSAVFTVHGYTSTDPVVCK